eukprot:c1450_g1_i2.p1 GENE.c1450_g1_i2~~c1450_g1_i2.p1  ORF type:complete len:362 (+),score=67.58 c1450_g1_i2:1-1086(+)
MGSVQLTAIAAAMAGQVQSPDSSLWTDLCAQLVRQQPMHPYLRACFSFLLSRGDLTNLLESGFVRGYGSDSTESVGSIIERTLDGHPFDSPHVGRPRSHTFEGVYRSDPSQLFGDILIQDRVAFALRFLPDSELIPELDRLVQHCKRLGLLEGLVLTGFGDEGRSLLQIYVNRTHDIQTSSLLLCQSPDHSDLLDQWLDRYSELLNQWQLWEQRCILDCALRSLTHKAVPPQVFAKCSYCGLSICRKVTNRSRGTGPRPAPSHTGTDDINPKSCHSCRKPLPRCSVCLLNFGTNVVSNGEIPDSGDGSIQFDSWFSWCQSCRHGGHSLHMSEWFLTHVVCPVVGCDCRCSIQDSRVAQMPV